MSLSAATYRTERNARLELQELLFALTQQLDNSGTTGLDPSERRVMIASLALAETLHGKLHLTWADSTLTKQLHSLKSRVAA